MVPQLIIQSLFTIVVISLETLVDQILQKKISSKKNSLGTTLKKIHLTVLDFQFMVGFLTNYG